MLRRDAETTSAMAQDEAASAELAGLLRCEVCYALARGVWEPARQAVHAAAAVPPNDRLLRLLRGSCQGQARLLLHCDRCAKLFFCCNRQPGAGFVRALLVLIVWLLERCVCGLVRQIHFSSSSQRRPCGTLSDQLSGVPGFECGQRPSLRPLVTFLQALSSSVPAP